MEIYVRFESSGGASLTRFPEVLGSSPSSCRTSSCLYLSSIS